MFDEQDRKYFYDEFKNNGYQVGSYDDFKKDLNNKEDRDWYYNEAKNMGYDVGTQADFDKMVLETSPSSPSPTTAKEATPAVTPSEVQSAPVAQKPQAQQPTATHPAEKPEAEDGGWRFNLLHIKKRNPQTGQMEEKPLGEGLMDFGNDVLSGVKNIPSEMISAVSGMFGDNGASKPQSATQQSETVPATVQAQQPTAKEVDAVTGETPTQQVDAIYNKYVGKSDALSETMADLMYSGQAQNQEEAQTMAMGAMNRAADRLAQRTTDAFVGKLGDTVANIDEAMANGWYSHEVQDNLKSMAAQLGIMNNVAVDANGNYITQTDGYDQFINGKVKPAMVESLVRKYGESYRKQAEGVANRLYSHDDGIQNRLMNQDINAALASVIGKYVSTSVMDEYNKAQEAGSKAFSEGMEGSQYIPANLRIGTAIASQYEANQAKDPKKVLNTLQKKFGKLYQNQQFLNDIADAVSGVMQGYGVQGGLSGDHKQFKPMVNAVIQNELNNLEVKGMMPKGSAEYIMKTGLGNTIVGKIARKTMQTDYQNWLEDIANQQYQPGFWENVASGALTFAGDAWSYWLPGAAGGKITKSMLAKAEGRLATDLWAKGMERKMAERAAKILVGKSKGMALKSGAAHGAATFGGQAAISKPIDEVYRTGQFDENGKIYNPSVGKILANTLGEVTKQTAIGAVMQGGTIANMVGKGKGLATNILADVGGKIADSGIMTGQQMLERMAHDPNFKPTGKDAAESFLESMANLTAIGLPSMMGKYARFKDAREFNRKYDFTDQDITDLKRMGYDGLRDAFGNMGINGYRADGEGVQMMGQLTGKYMNMMNDKTVPEVLKAKMMAVVEGKRPSSFSPVIDSIIVQPMDNGGKVYLETLNKDGGIIDRKEYSSLAEAQKADKKLDFEKSLNITSEYEKVYHTDALQDRMNTVYQQARDKYAAGEKLSDEDKTAIYLHQNAHVIGDIIQKQQSGMELSEQEQKLVNTYRHFYDSAFENSPIMKEYVRTFEDSQGVEHGTLRKALEGNGKSRTAEQQRLVEEYQKQLYNDIVLKREMKQTVDDLYNATHNRGQERIAQSEIVGETPVEKHIESPASSDVPPAESPTTPVGGGITLNTEGALVEGSGASNEPNVATSDAFAMGQEAYNNGDADGLQVIHRKDDLSKARLKRAFADNEELMNTVLKAYEEGKDMEQFVAQRAGYMTPAQQDAVRQYVEAQEAKRGVLDALQHADDGYAETLTAQLWDYQTEDGNIVPVVLSNGMNAFLKKANEYGGCFVVKPDKNGNPEIWHTTSNDIKEMGTPIPFDEFINQQTEEQKDARKKQFIALFDGSDLKPGVKVYVAMESGDEPMEMTFAGYSEDGKVILSDGKDNIALTKDEFNAWRQNALETSIGAELDAEDAQRAEEEAAQADAKKQERYKKGIFGYADGKPDYADPQTDPKVAAEYLQETSGADRKALFGNIAAEKKGLQTRINQLREHIANNEEWLSVNADLDPKNAETRTIANKEMEGQIAELQVRFDNWNKIRSAVMTPEEAAAIKNDRSQKIKDAGVDESAIVPIEEREVPVLSDKELKKQYPTMDEANDYITSERKRIYKIQSDEVQREIDGVDEILNRYMDGEIDLEPEQIKELNTTKAQLLARQQNLTESAKELKAQADGLKKLYAQENKKARAEILKNMSPAEQRAVKVEQAVEDGNLSLLNSIYEEVRGATDFTDTEPNSLEEYVANSIGRFSLNYEGKEKGGTFSNGLQQETGLDRKDFNKLQILAKEGEGKTVAEFVHGLFNGMPDHLRDMGYNDTDIRNTFLGLVRSAERYSDLKNYTLNNRIADAEQQMRALEQDSDWTDEEISDWTDEEIDRLADVESKWENRIDDYIAEHYPNHNGVRSRTQEEQAKYDAETEAMKHDAKLAQMRKDADAEYNTTKKEIENNHLPKDPVEGLNKAAEGYNEEKRETLSQIISKGIAKIHSHTDALRKAVESGDKKAITKAQTALTEAILNSGLGHKYLYRQLDQYKMAKKTDESYQLKRAAIKPCTDALKSLEDALETALQEVGLEGVHVDFRNKGGDGWVYADKGSVWHNRLKALDNDFRWLLQEDGTSPIRHAPQLTLENAKQIAKQIKYQIEDGEEYNKQMEGDDDTDIEETPADGKGEENAENLPFDAQMSMEDLPFSRDVKEVKPSEMTETQKVSYDAVTTILKKAGIPVKVISNEDMEKVAEEQDNLVLSRLMSDPRLRFNIKTPEQKKAANAAYDWASKHRPDKHKQYAIVNMNKPNEMPEYFEKKDLAERARKYYSNEWRVGNYKAFDLDKPFEEQVKNVVGEVPSEFDPYKGTRKADKIAALQRQKEDLVKQRTELQKKLDDYNFKRNKSFFDAIMDYRSAHPGEEIPDSFIKEATDNSIGRYDPRPELSRQIEEVDAKINAIGKKMVADGGNISYLKGKGTVYGYTDGKEIVLNQEHLNPNTPIHEYQHIWRTAAKEKNPDLIAHGDKLIMQTSLFADLKKDPNYKHLSDEQLCDEAFSRLTGEDGAKILEDMAKEAIKENPLDTAKELSVINKLKDWLKKFWYWTLDTFTKWKPEDIKKMTLEDIRNLVLRDLAKGVDPRKVLKERKAETETTPKVEKIGDNIYRLIPVKSQETVYMDANGNRLHDVKFETIKGKEWYEGFHAPKDLKVRKVDGKYEVEYLFGTYDSLDAAVEQLGKLYDQSRFKKVGDGIQAEFQDKGIVKPAKVVKFVSKEQADTISMLTGKSLAEIVKMDNKSGKYSLKGNASKGKNQKEDDKTLVGVHNITEEKLRKALKLGGFANPSVAVIDTGKSAHNSFGEISFIAPSALVDKRTGGTAGTWTTDAYTQRYPSVERKMSDKGYEKFKDWVEGLDYPADAKAEIERQAKAALEDNREPAWELMYLKEKGIDIKGYDSKVHYLWQEIIENHPSAEDILESMKSDPKLNEDVTRLATSEIISPTWRRISQEVSAQMSEELGRRFSPINPKLRAKVKEIFERDYAPSLLNKDGSPKKADVKKVVKQMVQQYEDTKTVSFQKSKVMASSYVHNNGLYADYIRWQENKLDEFGTKNRLFRGYRNDGTRKYVPETLENVSKAMRDDAEGQTNGSEYTTFGSFIAKLADRVDSTDEMRARKDKLSSNEDKQDFYEKWEEVYYDLAKFLYNDVAYGEQRLHDIATKNDPKKYAKKEYGITLTPTFMKNLDALKKAVREELKSNYFETKFERPVHLDEFVAAVVPQDLGADVRKGLEKSGLRLYDYDASKEGDRQRAFDEAINGGDNIRFMFAGERGAAEADKAEEQTIRMDNLKVAEEMERGDKDAKAIKLATGWERGADGKWRYEIPDIEYVSTGDADLNRRVEMQPWGKEYTKLTDRMLDGETLNDAEMKRFEELSEKAEEVETSYRGLDKNSLADYVRADDLFKAYPELRAVNVVFVNKDASVGGSYSDVANTIYVNENSSLPFEEVFAHEIQHAIQYIEGFAKGGSPEMFHDPSEQDRLFAKFDNLVREKFGNNDTDTLYGILDGTTEEYRDFVQSLGGEYNQTLKALRATKKYTSEKDFRQLYDRDVKEANKPSAYTQYRSLAGEVEARNVQKRMGMTDEERRNSLASETEDVNRDEQIVMNGDGASYSIVEDPKTIEKLDQEETVTVYRAMQLGEDGKLYPPMAAKVKGKFVQPIELGKWEQADERPDLADDKGKFTLNKGNGKSLKAAYNPYLHTSRTPLNDQFSEAQSRPNIVTVEVEVPKSELTSGYKAEKAKDAVGEVEWKAGIIQGQLTGKRKVILSRWDKPIRIVPDSEVADVIVNDMFKDKKVVMPTNVVTPGLRKELEKRGVPFVETDNQGRIVGGENDGVHYSQVYGKKATVKARIGSPTIGLKAAKDRVVELFNKAKSGEFNGKPQSIGTLTQEGKRFLEGLSGLKMKDKIAFVLNPSDLKHMDKDHFGDNEKDPGRNVPLTEEDLRSMVDVIMNPDQVVYGIEKLDNRKAFFFLKHAEDGTLNLAEIYSDKKGNLTAKSYYKTKKGVDQRVMEIKNSLLPTPEASSGSPLSDGKGINFFSIEQEKTEESAANERKIADAVTNTANQLGGAEANVYTSLDDVPEEYQSEVEQGAKGWYDPETHTVHVYLPNCEDGNDAQRTVFHEKIGHEGMEVLLGGESGVRKFANFVYKSVGKKLRGKILDFANKYDPDWKNPDRMNVGTQEYIAHLAEEGPMTAEDFSLWTKIKHYLIKALKKLGIRVPGLLNDKDLRYYLMKAGKALHVWDNMPKAKQEAMMAQASNADIKDALSDGAGKGKPRQKKGESAIQYMKRVMEWRRWKEAREDKEDPEPPQFYDFDKDIEGKKEWEQLNRDWRDVHGLKGDEMPMKPERKEGESDADFLSRYKEWEKWNNAMTDKDNPMPDMFSFEKERQKEASKKYEDWLARHELLEQQQADLDLYEGKIYPAETNPEADALEQRVMQDLAEVTSTDVSKEGAARIVKYAVIHRRKNMEEASADDAIYINDVKNRIEKMADSGAFDKLLSDYQGKPNKAEKLAEAIPYIIEAPRRLRDIAYDLNNTGAFDKGHIHIQPDDVEAIQPYVDDLTAETYKKHIVVKNGEEVEVYDDPQAVGELASKMAQAINANHQGEEDFVPIDGTDILNEQVLPLVRQRIVPEGIDYKNVTPEMQATLDSIRDWYNYTYDWLKDNHTLREDTGFNNDYVNHLWDKEKSDKRAYATYVENRQRTKSPNEKPRTISTLMEGISVGLVPKTTDITKMMAYYSRSNIEAYVNKTMLQELSGLNVIERNEEGEIISSDPLLSSTAPINLEQYRYFEIPGVGPVWVYNVSPNQVKVKNPISGKEKVLYSEASAGDRFGVVFDTYQSSPFWKAFDTLASSAKKLELGFSGFHAGALTEVYMVQNMVEFGPKKALANFMKYIFADTLKNHQLPCFANPEDFQEAATHLVKFGATNDYAAADVQNMFDNFRDSMMKIQEKLGSGNVVSKAGATVSLPFKVASQMLSLINKGMDRALWDFLHDGLKLASYRMRAEKTKARAKAKGWTAEQLSKALDEDGQFVNDMFGGQHWDVLGASHRTLRYAGRVLLSPDWNASTTRHFLALTGYGSVWNEATFENFKNYYKHLWSAAGDKLYGSLGLDKRHQARIKAKVEKKANDELWSYERESDLQDRYSRFVNAQRAKKQISPEEWGRTTRQLSSLLCYGLGFMVFYEAFANGINAAFRAIDEEKERKKAEEIRKTNPNYKSPYELAYPDGMKWYDYLMRGNTLGQQSKIFVGKYADGTEMYVRHGKQFREVPEYLFNHKGELEFPGPMVQRMIGKANPMVRMTLDDINYLSDFQASHADQELQQKYGKTIGLLYKDALYWAPFLIPSQDDKEFKAVDFFFPSSKGFSPWKAQDYFKNFILSGDMEGVMMTYQSCQKNGVDAEKQLQAAISSIKALEAKEMQDGVVSLQVASERFDGAKSVTEKRKMREKMRKFLAQGEYKAFTQQEAMDMVKEFQEGVDPKEMLKSDSKYLMVANSEDVTEDWRIQQVKASTKGYADKLSELKETDKAKMGAFRNAHANVFKARKAIGKATAKMNKLKKKLGEGNDAAILKQIRTVRKDLLKDLNGMEHLKEYKE